MAVQHIGVISDTHGLLRDEVGQVFSGCSLIIHAGDIGTLSVLRRLKQIAEVVAVRQTSSFTGIPTDRTSRTGKAPSISTREAPVRRGSTFPRVLLS